MHVSGAAHDFSIIGGPLHRLGGWLGLVRGQGETVRLGLAIAAFLWLVWFVLKLVDGAGDEIFSWSLVGGHVRILVAIPMFFVCETLANPRMAMFGQGLMRMGIMPESALPAMQAEIERSARWRDSWLAEGACLLIAALMLAAPREVVPGSTASYTPGLAGADSLAEQWYLLVCLTVVRFLLLRWLLHLFLWYRFLVFVARQDLRLVAIHPDGVAGLGYLELVQARLVLLAFAMSAILAASFAEDILAGRMAFEASYLGIVVILAVYVALFLGPLLVFAPKLEACRARATSKYKEFAQGYVRGFEEKWLAGPAPEKALLGSPDLQSLADLANSMNIVRDMRVVPVSKQLVQKLLVAALVPMLPLVLLKYPVTELVGVVFRRLSGM
jgi:hypothetical protein